MPIPLARPVLGEPEERAVLDVLRSGHLSLGSKGPEFERAFAARIGARYASAVSSGTTGLHLALRAVGVRDGTEVITTPFSFVASANVAVYERARPVFVDIDPVTLNLNAEEAVAAINPRTAALLPVHVFGYPADMRRLEQTQVPIVEDACEALGGVYADGGAIGGRGHPATFAFYANKQMTTGEGGIIMVDDPKMKERFDSERNQGRAPNMDWLDHDRLGFNYRLSDIAAALGLAQLQRLDELLAGRERVAGLYRAALQELPELTLPCENIGQARRGWFVYVIQLPHGVDRDSAVTELGARGVAAKPYFPAIHLMSYYQETFGFRRGQFPICEDVSDRSIAIPFFPQMSEGQVARVAEELTGVLHGARRARRAS
ncbi:MAG TPA: DegT/DnrJ/EryC1/StrS family aminotransferase [Solirubrobacteraceae bacterium]|jgi:perosamine synthetase|nr:DegT/DnrJ/EryC1/StrS family aminotransferase [Solirubrobacteraceae bacterium]